MGGRNRWLRRLVAVLAAVAAGVLVSSWWTGALWQWLPRDDYDRFQGVWRIVVADRATPNRVRIVGDRWEYLAEQGDSRLYRMELDLNVFPRRLRLELLDNGGLVGPIPRLHGIYAFENRHQVRLCLLPAAEPLPESWDEVDLTQTLLRE
ncbi:MAG: hypothetical protein NZ703_06930 [Gemmataceae bacterium]|nr:hypothetical protein [Gemmataceae bacterium]MCS7270802.1 hypothetical protein [Gemmataceae bacterium]MDW8243675.1 hypothetical protein [Thermogemmata sp.]